MEKRRNRGTVAYCREGSLPGHDSVMKKINRIWVSSESMFEFIFALRAADVV